MTVRVPLFLTLLVVLIFAAAAKAQTAAFAHDPARVPIGTTYEFVKSNLDGTQAIRVVARLAARAGLSGTRVWTAESDGRLLAIESSVPDNPGWSSFRLELQSTASTTEAEWAAFVEREVAALAPAEGT